MICLLNITSAGFRQQQTAIKGTPTTAAVQEQNNTWYNGIRKWDGKKGKTKKVVIVFGMGEQASRASVPDLFLPLLVRRSNLDEILSPMDNEVAGFLFCLNLFDDHIDETKKSLMANTYSDGVSRTISETFNSLRIRGLALRSTGMILWH